MEGVPQVPAGRDLWPQRREGPRTETEVSPRETGSADLRKQARQKNAET